jgi:LSD1 subclass zinc finger protein
MLFENTKVAKAAEGRKRKQRCRKANSIKIPPMIPQDLLELLACPACKTPLSLKEGGQSLSCAQCRLVYPIRDGIPVLLLDQASPETT